MADTRIEERRVYWQENPRRWKRILRTAADVCAMFDLPCPGPDVLAHNHPGTALSMMWWRKATLNGQSRITGVPQAGTDIEQMEAFGDPEDRLLCWSSIVGILSERHLLDTIDLRVALMVSGSLCCDGLRRWEAESPDFRAMMHGLSGDMANLALRRLVLGLRAEGDDGSSPEPAVLSFLRRQPSRP